MKNTANDIVYRCDAQPAIGIGHLKRGIDVVAALRRRRPSLQVAIAGEFSPSARDFLDRLGDPGVPVLPALPAEPSRMAVVDTMFDPEQPGFIDPATCAEMKRACSCLVLISGVMALDLPESVDVVVNHIPDVEIRGGDNARRYLGFEFAPVAAEILAEAEPSRSDRDVLLAVVGGNRIQNGPQDLLDSLALESLDEVVMIVSPQFPTDSLRALHQDFPEVRFAQNVPSLARFIAAASVVVCTYGHTTYESLSIHRPTFLANYKDFQNRYADYLETKGLVRNLGKFGALRKERLNELGASGVRTRLHNAAKAAFRGPGIERIADVLLEEIDRV